MEQATKDAGKPAPAGEQRGRDPREQTEEQGRAGADLIKAAADGAKLSGVEQSAALDWFLSDDPDDDQELTRTIELNVGGAADGEQQWIPWTIRAVDLDTLRNIRKQAMGPRAQRRAGGEIDEVQANLRIVVAGTVEPDLTFAAHQRKIADPATALQMRFRKKPGLLGQISGEIMSLSGYDDEDVREVSAGK